MTVAPMKPCGRYGCGALVRRPARFCRTHETDAARGRPDAAARGYDRRWADYSRRYLARHRICRTCGARATVVDHVQSARARPDRFYDPSNHQPLCQACNKRKAIGSQGIGR